MRAWTAVISERTRIKREELADEISRIPDEQLRADLRGTMGELFRFLEDDLERGGSSTLSLPVEPVWERLATQGIDSVLPISPRSSRWE